MLDYSWVEANVYGYKYLLIQVFIDKLMLLVKVSSLKSFKYVLDSLFMLNK